MSPPALDRSISVAIPNRDYCPRVATRCQHHVHQEATDATVSVHIGMDVDEEGFSQSGYKNGYSDE
jgi:hypothetical protein